MARTKGQPGFQVEEVTIRVQSLRQDAPALRFAHLSDIHMRALRRRHEALVDLIAERKPDFVFLTGDIISHRPATWDLLKKLMGRFAPRHGVFACPGNWEASLTVRDATLKELAAGAGAELLINESRTVQTPSGKVRIAGVGDLVAGWPDFESTLREGRGCDYTILLSHAPLAARFVEEDSGVDLVLSGHTHGGQIRIPVVWRWLQPSCHGGFPAGLYPMDWGYLYVNRGFGSVGWAPVRFRCPAEATFFEVKPGGRQ